MPRPRLTFACELSSERLDDLFADRSVIAGLRALNSRVALALAAFTPERAGVVHRLNDEGGPVLAIPLLSYRRPRRQGSVALIPPSARVAGHPQRLQPTRSDCRAANRIWLASSLS